MIIGGGNVLPIVGDYRLVWISGRYGGGKTLLAMEIAESFLKRGYRLLTNIPCAWADDWDSVQLQDDGRLRAVVIMDEAGLVLKYTEQLEAMCAYSRKMDCIYLFPSFMPPVRFAQVVDLHSMFSLAHVLLPITFWSCRIRLGSFRETTSFATSKASLYYGVYSTQGTDRGTEDLIELLATRTEEFRKRNEAKHKYTGSQKRDGVRKVALRPRDEAASALRDSAGAMEEAADTIASIPIRTRRR